LRPRRAEDSHSDFAGPRHIVELLVELGHPRLQLVHRVMQRLHLAGDLIQAARRVGVLLLAGSLFKVSTLDDILLMLSVVCSTRFFITPMRSSNDCCMRAICSCSACTCVCNWIMSLLAANAGREAQTIAIATEKIK